MQNILSDRQARLLRNGGRHNVSTFPVPISDMFADTLGLERGALISREESKTLLTRYAQEHNLLNGLMVHCDNTLRNLCAAGVNDSISILNADNHLSHHFQLSKAETREALVLLGHMSP
jgi:hypothetical protein